MDAAARARIDAWLPHLKRDRRGMAVPYINQWGPTDDESRFYVRRDTHAAGRDAWFCDDSGDTPDFTQKHLGRQRECMTGGRCQVCRRPVPLSRRYIPIATFSAEAQDVGGVQRVVLTEPWLDERCAEIATRWCPALIRAERAAGFTIHPVRSMRDFEIVLTTGAVGDPSPYAGASTAVLRALPVMWVKVALLNLDVQVRGR